jgi:hypothetical protein
MLDVLRGELLSPYVASLLDPVSRGILGGVLVLLGVLGADIPVRYDRWRASLICDDVEASIRG